MVVGMEEGAMGDVAPPTTTKEDSMTGESQLNREALTLGEL